MHPLEQKLAESWPASDWQEVSVVLAVSGGADSVALLRAMAKLKTAGGGRLAVAHLNHRLRGDEADADQEFVVRLCSEVSIPCVAEQADLKTAAGEGGLEEAARGARYDFLQRTAEKLGARFVATGHTADDRAETILHHVIRGTGLAGLAGMPRARALGPAVTLIRPMLEIGRDEVIEYLASLNQPYCEDATNAQLQFTRNRIRHELLPLLRREYSPSVVEALLRLGNLATGAQRLIERIAADLLDRCQVQQHADAVVLDCELLAGEDRHLVREAMICAWRRQSWPLRAMGSAEWNLLADLAVGVPTSSVKTILPGAIAAERQGRLLVLRSQRQ